MVFNNNNICKLSIHIGNQYTSRLDNIECNTNNLVKSTGSIFMFPDVLCHY